MPYPLPFWKKHAPGLSLAALVIVVVVFAGFALRRLEPLPAGGCCQVGAGCASGQGVTQDHCEGELSGTWNAGEECDTATGACG